MHRMLYVDKKKISAYDKFSCSSIKYSYHETYSSEHEGKIAMFDHCPGTADLRTPTLTIKRCPQCGKEVEVFSNDVKVTCSNCGHVVWNDIRSCVQWCKYAKECIGEETYQKIMAAKEEQH